MADWRAISILQPYASAIISGPKRVENRGTVVWRPPRGGHWVAVHASKGWYDVDPWSWDVIWPESPDLDDEAAWTRGAILGVMHVAEVRSYASRGDVAGAARMYHGPWAFGPVCYLIDDVRALREPIPARGALGLWAVPGEHHAALDGLVTRG